jgi:hypothetical protein
MKLQRTIICLAGTVLVLALLCPLALSAQRRNAPDAAVRVVKSFYRFHLSHNMNFTARNIRLRRRWFTPELYGLLLYEMKRQDEHAKTNPDDVPYYNGDPFTTSQVYPDWFSVGQSSFDDDTAKVKVNFFWGKRGAVEDERAIEIVLTRRGGRWLIGDLIDMEGSKLRDELRREKFLP